MSGSFSKLGTIFRLKIMPGGRAIPFAAMAMTAVKRVFSRPSVRSGTALEPVLVMDCKRGEKVNRETLCNKID